MRRTLLLPILLGLLCACGETNPVRRVETKIERTGEQLTGDADPVPEDPEELEDENRNRRRRRIQQYQETWADDVTGRN